MARPACSTVHSFSALWLCVSFSRQQGNTFTSIKRPQPQRRYSDQLRFFYGPPVRHGGMLSQLQVRRIMAWPVVPSSGLTSKRLRIHRPG